MKKQILFLMLSFLPAWMWAEKLEAEHATYSACRLISNAGYSGGKALEVTESNARISFSFEAPRRGKYTIRVAHDALYGDKVGNITVGGNTTSFKMSGKAETTVGTFIMLEGQNTIVITPNWTWFRIDYIVLELVDDELAFDISPDPVDEEATLSARELYAFLHDNFGKKTISGIMTGDMASANGNVTQHADMQAVYEASGRYPALVGFDFMNATGRDEANDWCRSYTRAVILLAKDTWRRGGIPAFTWHWRDPSRQTGEFYTDNSKARITNALNTDGSWKTSSTLYKYILRDIRTIGNLLLELQRADVACIFRPLHEASGGWFWWGCEGAEPCVKLFRLVVDELTKMGVHNVIWVWNAGDNDVEWNPGDDYYDVVSADIYNPDFDYSSSYVSFDNLKVLTRGKKIIALSENGPLPDINKEFDEDAVWSWWMPWYQTWNGKFVDKTSNEEWQKCMGDERVVTLEDRVEGWQWATSISSTLTAEAASTVYYDLQGRRLASPPRRGVFITGNRKWRTR